MKIRRVWRILGLVLLLVSLILLCWGFWPLGDTRQVLPVPPSDLQLPTPQGGLWLGIGLL